jgi:cytochrome c-type biogenesis protein CcmH/NrfF
MQCLSLFARANRLRLLPALLLSVLVLLGAGDDSARVSSLGHQMMCACGCNQILLECNHVGCAYSTRMRNELIAAVDRGDSDNNVVQWFVQTYGTTVLVTPTKTGFNRVAWITPYGRTDTGNFYCPHMEEAAACYSRQRTRSSPWGRTGSLP